MDKLTKINKSFIILIVLLVCLAMVLVASFQQNTYAATNIENNIISQFAEKYGIEDKNIIIKELEDFDGNKFILAEFSDKAYAIYTKNNMQFIEGSAQGKSPYYGYNGSLYYLGPLSYYVEKDFIIYDLLSGEKCNFKKSSALSYDFDTLTKVQAKNQTMVSRVATNNNDNNEPIVINGYEYFENATYPKNDSGSCAITAISLLLGYFDTYHNDNFVEDGVGDIVYIKKYDKVESINFSDIQNMLPIGVGTTNAFGDLMMNNYMHYNELFGEIFGGYPMAEMEIKDTMKDYLSSRSSIDANSITHYSGSIIYTHKKPASYLKQGIPVILVLSKYDHQSDKKGWHTVVAYKYNEKDDVFTVNYGWGSNYNSVLLSNYTVYAYYAMAYNGEHVHSGNMVGQHKYTFLGTKYVSTIEKCGCGQLIPVSIKKDV